MRPVLITFILSLLNLGCGFQSFHSYYSALPALYPHHRYLFGVSPFHGPQPGSDPAEGTAGWEVARGGGRGGPGPVVTQPPRPCRLRGPPQMLRGTRGLSQQTAYSLQTRQQQQQKAHMVKIRSKRAFCLGGLAITSQKCKTLNLNFWWASAGLTT